MKVYDQRLYTQFNNISPGKQREYADHIGSAKRDSTKQKRLEKCIPQILE